MIVVVTDERMCRGGVLITESLLREALEDPDFEGLKWSEVQKKDVGEYLDPKNWASVCGIVNACRSIEEQAVLLRAGNHISDEDITEIKKAVDKAFEWVNE